MGDLASAESANSVLRHYPDAQPILSLPVESSTNGTQFLSASLASCHQLCRWNILTLEIECHAVVSLARSILEFGHGSGRVEGLSGEAGIFDRDSNEVLST